MIRFVLARLTRYGSFYKFLALHVAGILLLAEIASRFSSLSLQGSTLPLAQLFAYPEVWGTLTALSRWLFFVPAFFTVQLVCAELELKLVRAHVINGLSRGEVAVGWTLQNLLLTVVATAATVVAVVLFGNRAAPGSIPGIGGAALPLGGFLLYGWAFLNWAVLCGVLLRRPVPALVLLLLAPLVIEPMTGMALRHYGMDGLAGVLPFATLSELVPWPSAEAAGPGAVTVLLAGVYGAVAALLSWAKLRLVDL